MIVYFIRHGQTDGDVKGVLSGPGDTSPLNSFGKDQMREVGMNISDKKVELILSSPDARGKESLEIIKCIAGIPRAGVIENLQTRNWGEWIGKTWNEVSQTLSQLSLEERYEYKPQDGESWKEMEGRLKGVLENISKEPYQTIAVVMHGSLLRTLVPLLTGNLQSSLDANFKNGDVVKAEYTEGKWKMLV